MKNMPNKLKVDVRDEIVNYLFSIERNLRWLSIKLNIPYGSAYSIFKQKVMELKQPLLDQINTILCTDFTL
jgi:hypothetical protein